jgi:hypothetical protein
LFADRKGSISFALRSRGSTTSSPFNVARTGDTAYRIGQRLVIREAAVCECLALIERLAAAMASDANATEKSET